jgi:hypothetical protein
MKNIAVWLADKEAPRMPHGCVTHRSSPKVHTIRLNITRQRRILFLINIIALTCIRGEKVTLAVTVESSAFGG